MNRWGGRAFPFTSFFTGELCIIGSLSSSFSPDSSGFVAVWSNSDSETVSSFFATEVIGDLRSGLTLLISPVDKLSIPSLALLFSLFSSSSLSSVFVLLTSDLLVTPLLFKGIVNVNLDLWEGDAKGTEGVACLVFCEVGGFVTVEVVDGVRWKYIPDLTGVPTSKKTRALCCKTPQVRTVLFRQ